MPVTILAGDEEFELSRRVDELKKEIVDPSWVDFNFSRLSNPEVAQVVDAAATLPFGPGKRMVLFDRCELFTKKKSKAGSDDKISEKALKTLLDDLDAALSAVSPDTHLVFACPYNFDPTLRTSKVAGKHAAIETFSKQRYYAGGRNPVLDTWCRKEAKRAGATIADEAITYLLDSTEANLRQVASEIVKAAVYIIPDKHITLEAVTSLSSHFSHVFALLDHWSAGRRKLALTSLDELLARQSGIPIIATIHTTLSKWIQLKAASDEISTSLPGGRGVQRRELSKNDLAQRLAVELKSTVGIVKMDLERTKSLTAELLAQKQIELCRLEKLVKSGAMSDHHALTVFFST